MDQNRSQRSRSLCGIVSILVLCAGVALPLLLVRSNDINSPTLMRLVEPVINMLKEKLVAEVLAMIEQQLFKKPVLGDNQNVVSEQTNSNSNSNSDSDSISNVVERRNSEGAVVVDQLSPRRRQMIAECQNGKRFILAPRTSRMLEASGVKLGGLVKTLHLFAKELPNLAAEMDTMITNVEEMTVSGYAKLFELKHFDKINRKVELLILIAEQHQPDSYRYIIIFDKVEHIGLKSELPPSETYTYVPDEEIDDHCVAMFLADLIKKKKITENEGYLQIEFK